MTDVFENQPEPHRATSLPERQRAALTAIGPENGKRAQQRRGALTAAQVGPIPSAEAWFAAGERIGYDPNARTIVPVQDASLRIFLSGEGDLAQAVSFLP